MPQTTFTYLCRESVQYESEGWAIFVTNIPHVRKLLLPDGG